MPIRQNPLYADPLSTDLSFYDTGRAEVYGALAGDAIEQSVTGFVYRAGRRTLGAMFDDTPELMEPDAANAQFGIEDHLTFDKPVRPERAKELFEIKQRELYRADTIARGPVGMGEAFAVSLAASIIDPAGDALALIPYLGTSAKAKQTLKAASLATRARYGFKEGLMAGALTEAVIAPLAIWGEGRDYGLDDLLLNLALTGGLGAGARAFGRIDADGAEPIRADDHAFLHEVAASLGIERSAYDGREADIQSAFDDGASWVEALTEVIGDGGGADPLGDFSVETRQAVFQAAVGQAAKGEPVDVAPIIEAAHKGRAQEQLGQPGADIPARVISEGRAYNADNAAIDVRYALVELDALVPSHTDEFLKNPAYPSVLQPRAREEKASLLQVRKIAAELIPEKLGESPDAASGAPIIAPDGIVESGNGRTLALRLARNEGLSGAADYQAWLKTQGYDAEGMDFPVLVRIAPAGRDPETRAAFARSANKSDQADMSVKDRGAADAATIPDDVFLGDIPDNLAAASGRDFVASILRAITGTNDLPALLDSDGGFSVMGLQRAETAIASRAFEDRALIRDMFINRDPEAAAINGALIKIAPRWAALRILAKRGDIPADLDITAYIVNAAAKIRRLRQRKAKGEKITLAQLDAETQTDLLNPVQDIMETLALHLFYGPKRDKNGAPVGDDPLARANSGKAVQTYLNRYIDLALEQNTQDLLGGSDRGPADLITALTGAAQPAIRTREPARSGDTGQLDLGGQSGTGADAEISRGALGAARDAQPAEGVVAVADRPQGTAPNTDTDVSLFDAAPARENAPGKPDDGPRDVLDDPAAELDDLRAELTALAEIGGIDGRDLIEVMDELDAAPDPERVKSLRRGIIEAAHCVIEGGL